MVNNLSVQKLTEVSRNTSLSFEEFFEWDKYSVDEGEYFMPPELLSIYGTDDYANLTREQIRELSRIEAIQVMYLYAYTESVMCYYLARHLVKSEFWSEEHAFVLREQIEEYRHQDMFLRWLEILGKDFHPMSRFTKWWTWLEAIILPARYFFLLQITIELISREVWRMCFQDKKVNKLVRDLCLMHEKEEVRHVAFSDGYLEKAFKNAGFFARTFGGMCIALDIAFINHFYIYPWMYQKSWIWNDGDMYKLARKNIRSNKVKNMLTWDAIEFLRQHHWITWANSWMFRVFTWITYQEVYERD